MKKTTFFICTILALSTIGLQTTPAQIATFEHGDVVLSVAFSPVDDTTLASGSGDGTVKLWNAATHTNIATLEGHTDWIASVAFSPDGTMIASGSGDGTVKLWNAATHTNIATLEGHTNEIASVAFSPDGTTIASGSGDGIIKLWDVATHQNTTTFGGYDAAILEEGGWFTPVAFSLDGKTLASGAADRVKLWDVATTQNTATLIEDPPAPIVSVAFSPVDGTTLASGLWDSIKLWDVTTRTNTATFPPTEHGDIFSPPLTFIAFSPDGTWIASTHDDIVVLWDVETHTPLDVLSGHAEGVRSVSFSRDGSLLASGAMDGTVKLWNTAHIPAKSNATVSISPASIVSPDIGEQLTLSLNITGGENVAGYEVTVSFDDSALDYTESANGGYLPADPFFIEPIGDYDWENDIQHVILAASAIAGTGNGDGTLATVTLRVVDFKVSTVTLSNVYLVDTDGKLWTTHVENAEITIPPEPAKKITEDINRDGLVNIQDLVIVSARFGQRGHNSADINRDGLVDVVDLVLVANAFGADAAAPSLYPQILEQLTAADIKGWLNQARQLSITDPAYLRGITVLEQLLMALTPKETALLANFPNPFNPETWIPYQLSKPAEVTLTIYAANGQVVRTLALGHQPAGIYQSRSRAAYWDGRNAVGEPVASGLYFYTLTAGDFTATRKMLIRK